MFLRHPLLTIGLSPQPNVLQGLAGKPGFRGRGLLGRFLYLLPPSPLRWRTLEPPSLQQTVTDAYDSGVHAILNTPAAVSAEGEPVPHVLKSSDNAYSGWLSFAREVEVSMRAGHDFEGATDWAGKCAGATARVAGVMHVIEHAHEPALNTIVSDETINRAVALMRIVARHSLHALDLMAVDASVAGARKVWEWIAAGRRENFSVRGACQALKGTLARVDPLREALEVLAERGYLSIVDPPKTGPGRRPSPVVLIRPDIVAKWNR